MELQVTSMICKPEKNFQVSGHNSDDQIPTSRGSSRLFCYSISSSGFFTDTVLGPPHLGKDAPPSSAPQKRAEMWAGLREKEALGKPWG